MNLKEFFFGRNKTAEAVIRDVDKILRRKMSPVFKQYGVEAETFMTPLKWQPLVLVIGNYSSGKSTLINELLGKQVQRTGQAPTDDCFTILTGLGPNQEESPEVPGSTLVNDEQLPFASLRQYGESLLAHLRLKRVDAPILKDLAIIDTPGMLDSVTEKDRGYDYLGVVRELARLADVILLMFDPHKAGTIKETYRAIRSTLPEAAGEDRVLYVLNRIDECDNIADLVHSYGTLCWNLSQMTGRKDQPRIYLTYAEGGSAVNHGVSVWAAEREKLKQAVKTAPQMRLNHILNEVDRGGREFSLMVEAMANFKKGFSRRLGQVTLTGIIASLLAFLFGDMAVSMLTGVPDIFLIKAVVTGKFAPSHLVWPLTGVFLVLGLVSIVLHRWLFPGYVKRVLADIDCLLPLETAYKKDLWQRIRNRVEELVRSHPWKQARIGHERNLQRVEQFLEHDLPLLYDRIMKG
ncbi:MAG: dynamin family protein [Desulfobacterales bacterium]|nr:dynamin family protein [Desulfobacterales bacterium]